MIFWKTVFQNLARRDGQVEFVVQNPVRRDGKVEFVIQNPVRRDGQVEFVIQNPVRRDGQVEFVIRCWFFSQVLLIVLEAETFLSLQKNDFSRFYVKNVNNKLRYDPRDPL